LSLERVIKALIGLGISKIGAKAYVYIAQNGSQSASDLAKALNYSKQQIYASLRILKVKGLVTNKDTIFIALPFEEALELLINQKKEKAESMSEKKKELLDNWETK